MTGSGPGDRVGNFVQKCVKDRLAWTIQGVILGNHDAFRSVFTHAQATLHRRQAECPFLQTVLHHLVACNVSQFLQVHARSPNS